MSETWIHDAKHAASLNLSNYQMINLHRQNDRTGGGVCVFIYESIDFKERKDFIFLKMTVKYFKSKLLTKQKISFLVQFIDHSIVF